MAELVVSLLAESKVEVLNLHVHSYFFENSLRKKFQFKIVD
jgi:hypothetical protein